MARSKVTARQSKQPPETNMQVMMRLKEGRDIKRKKALALAEAEYEGLDEVQLTSHSQIMSALIVVRARMNNHWTVKTVRSFADYLASHGRLRLYHLDQMSSSLREQHLRSQDFPRDLFLELMAEAERLSSEPPVFPSVQAVTDPNTTEPAHSTAHTPTIPNIETTHPTFGTELSAATTQAPSAPWPGGNNNTDLPKADHSLGHPCGFDESDPIKSTSPIEPAVAAALQVETLLSDDPAPLRVLHNNIPDPGQNPGHAAISVRARKRAKREEREAKRAWLPVEADPGTEGRAAQQEEASICPRCAIRFDSARETLEHWEVYHKGEKQPSVIRKLYMATRY